MPTFSPRAVESVEKHLDTHLKDGLCNVWERDSGMLPVWEHVLRERGYGIRVQWHSRAWGSEVLVEGTRLPPLTNSGLVQVTCHAVPAWVPMEDPGGMDLWVEPCSLDIYDDVVLLVQEIRQCNLSQAQKCVDRKLPLLEGVGASLHARVSAYLWLAGARVSSSTSSSGSWNRPVEGVTISG